MSDFEKRKSINMPLLVDKSPLLLLGVLGGMASSTAELITFPLDNIKTRM